jgi:hypothetical protein
MDAVAYAIGLLNDALLGASLRQIWARRFAGNL